jgi:hypothetical protein
MIILDRHPHRQTVDLNELVEMGAQLQTVPATALDVVVKIHIGKLYRPAFAKILSCKQLQAGTVNVVLIGFTGDPYQPFLEEICRHIAEPGDRHLGRPGRPFLAARRRIACGRHQEKS